MITIEAIAEGGGWTGWMSVVIEWAIGVWPYFLASVAWGVLLAAIFLGFIGVFVPVIPSGIVVFLGGLIHKLILPDVFSWWAIGILGVLMVLDRLVDFVATGVGTKLFGGTKWGITGALVGGFLGLFFGIFGILIGPVIGAVAFEMIWAKRHLKEAARSGVGAGVGFSLSAVGRMIVCFMMMGLLIVDFVVEDEVHESSGVLEAPSLDLAD
tara:strand:+ start:378 stop:1010 length:633 start_codon:yes stop_codon:yes gene_type:complete